MGSHNVAVALLDVKQIQDVVDDGTLKTFVDRQVGEVAKLGETGLLDNGARYEVVEVYTFSDEKGYERKHEVTVDVFEFRTKEWYQHLNSLNFSPACEPYVKRTSEASIETFRAWRNMGGLVEPE